jgi:hypothetical protein
MKNPKVSQQSPEVIRQMSERLMNPPKPDYQALGQRLREMVEEEGRKAG